MLALTLVTLLTPQQPASDTFPNTTPAPAIRLWEGDAPGSRGTEPHDIPTITPFLAPDALATGTAIVVFPGGGYGGLAGHEGDGYARWLNGLGIHAFVCKYRLGRQGYRHPCMLQDAARAVRQVRHLAARWDVDPGRVGVIGSSAGGHLASTILTLWDGGDADAPDRIERRSSRPDFGILCYPVIDMSGDATHRGSRRNLLGDEPSEELQRQLSTQLQVTADTPPTFLWHTAADAGVTVRNSYAFATALATAGVAHELHVYPEGRHGLGLGLRDPAGHTAAELLPWTRACARWLAAAQGATPLQQTVDAAILDRMRELSGAPAVTPRSADDLKTAATVVARLGDVLAVRGAADELPTLPGTALVLRAAGGVATPVRACEIRDDLLLVRVDGDETGRPLRAGGSYEVTSR